MRTMGRILAYGGPLLSTFGGGGSAYGLGPAQNTFANATARDAYATANPNWLAEYDDNRFFWIRTGTNIQRRNAAGDGWQNVTTVVQGPSGAIGPRGQRGQAGADGTRVTPHTPVDGDTEIEGIDIDGTDYVFVDATARESASDLSDRVDDIDSEIDDLGLLVDEFELDLKRDGTGSDSVTLPRSQQIRPYITGFHFNSGDQGPPAGSIAGNRYGIDWQISESGHVGYARIIGYVGEFDPDTEGNIQTIHVISPGTSVGDTKPGYANGQFEFSVPDGIMLMADQTYTIELQVYGLDNQAPAITDSPVSHQELHITAHAPATAMYHWGRVAWTSDTETAQDIADRVVFNDNDLITGNQIASGYDAEPGETGRWTFYLAVDNAAVQPTGWTSAGLPASSAFLDAVDRAIDSVDYKFYCLDPQLAREASDGSITYVPVTNNA